MKLIFKQLIPILSFILLLAGCTEDPQPEATVSISFNKTTYEMTVGDEPLDLGMQIKIENTDAAPTFRSSDPKVATISKSGLVTAVSAGSTEITATVKGETATCTVVVKAITSGKITLSCPSTTIEVGKEAIITATCESEDYDLSNLEWSCSSTPEGIVKFTQVDSWRYSVIFTEYQENASAVVTVKDKLSDASAQITLTNKQKEVARIALNHTELNVKDNNDPVQLTATCYDKAGDVIEDFNDIEWKSSDAKVAEVDQTGLVTFKGIGSATVTVTNKNNEDVKATCEITVKSSVIYVEDIKLYPSEKEIKVGEKFQINAVVSPENADDKTLTFTSSDKEIASVTAGGEVEGLAAGKADITVTSSNGISAVFKVTVKEVYISFNKSSYEMTIGDEPMDLAAELKIENSDSVPSFKSSDDEVATVTSAGKVTAVSAGSTDITATVDGVSATCKVTVKEATSGKITLTSTTPEIEFGKDAYITATYESNGYNPANLVWSCVSDPEGIAEFTKVSETEYKVRFSEYQEDAYAVITVKDKLSDSSAEITIKQKFDETKVEVTKIVLSDTQLEVKDNANSVQLTATCYDKNGNEVKNFSDLIWTTSNDSVAEVFQTGLVKIKGVGSALIKVTNVQNTEVYAECAITVNPSVIEVENINLYPPEKSLKVGDKFQINAVISPENADDKALTYTSSNTGIASVTATGEVEGRGAGEAKITVKSSNGVSAVCKVTVIEVSISFNKESYEMTIGDNDLDLGAELKIQNSDSAPSFTSSAVDVATVTSAGKVTAVSAGFTVITATVDGVSATCKVTVKEAASGKITLSATKTTIEVGTETIVKAAFESKGYNPSNLEWSCEASNASIVDFIKKTDTEYSFKFTEYQENAYAVITVKDKLSSSSANITINIEAKPDTDVVSITLNHTQLFKQVGDTPVQLSATCKNKSGQVIENYTELEWTATDDNGKTVVSVTQSGKISFKAVGTSTVKVINKHNRTVSATCNVTVSAADIQVSKVVISPYAKTIKVNEEFTISASVEPADAHDKTLTFTSSNTSVATVTSNGVVKGKTEGSADITVRASNGVNAVCKVTVSNSGTGDIDAPAVETIRLATSNQSESIHQLETLQIIPYYGPTGAVPTSSSWKSSDETLATVDNEGNVTAVYSEIINEEDEEIWVRITHTADGKNASIDLQILRALPKSITITAEPEGKKIYLGDTFQYTAKIEPALADQTVVWQCFDADGKSILNGISFYEGTFATGGVSPIKEIGEYTIRAKSHANNNVVHETKINVIPIEIESASLNYESVTLSKDGYVELFVNFNPHNATFKEIKWASSNTKVAVVSNGRVTAVGLGKADITATLSNGTVLTCKVTVEAAQAKVGDYYYSDGTWSTALDSSKECVGIVFSVDNVTLHDKTLAEDHPECTHGIVVSIKETAKVKWQGWCSDINTWAVNKGYMPLSGVECPSGTSDFYLTDNGKKLCGYNNTAAIEAYKKSTEYANGGDDVKIYLLDNMSSMTDIDNTSGWYVPSVSELNMIAANYDIINSKSKSAGGDAIATGYGISHWSSTEGKNNTTAVKIRLDNSTIIYNEPKWNEYNVRYVFAF